MWIVIGILGLLFLVGILFKLILPRDGAFRKNVKPIAFIVIVLAFVVFILALLYYNAKQLTIMLNVTEQMPFLKETTYEKREESVREGEKVLVIEIEADSINVAGKDYGDFGEARDKIVEAAMKYDRVLLIDNYATNATYQKVRGLILDVGIEEGNIQEKQEP